MSEQDKQMWTNNIFKSRQNCLLLNISTKGTCEDRFQLSVIDKLIPGFRRWCNNLVESPTLPDHTLVTFVCSSGMDSKVKIIGETDSYLPGFNQIVYLIKSWQLSGINIHLLKTTSIYKSCSELDNLISGKFRSVVFLDFYNWCQNDFLRFIGKTSDSDADQNSFFYYGKKNKISVPKAIAMMDGFNKVPYTEKDSRPIEIQETKDNYENKYHLKVSYLKDGYFDLSSLSYLLGLKPIERQNATEGLMERIRIIADYFGFSNDNLWNITIEFHKSRLTTKNVKYIRDNIINFWVVPTLKEDFLSQEEYDLFQAFAPNWQTELSRLLYSYANTPVPSNKLDKVCRDIIGEKFSIYIVNIAKNILKND